VGLAPVNDTELRKILAGSHRLAGYVTLDFWTAGIYAVRVGKEGPALDDRQRHHVSFFLFLTAHHSEMK
jgi:hypothetical protein